MKNLTDLQQEERTDIVISYLQQCEGVMKNIKKESRQKKEIKQIFDRTNQTLASKGLPENPFIHGLIAK
jgi:hypothetical protein